MRTGIIVVEDRILLFLWSLSFDYSVKSVKLSQIGVTVNTELALAIFVINFTNNYCRLRDFPVDDSASAPTIRTTTPVSPKGIQKDFHC